MARAHKPHNKLAKKQTNKREQQKVMPAPAYVDSHEISTQKNERLDQFVFREQDHVGFNDALSDRAILEKCFIGSGDFESLVDVTNCRSLILGRTGAGKTALVLRLESQVDNVINVEPDQLSLAYISNSQIIRYFMSIGVDLGLFFNQLWRHILCIEIIRAHFHVDSANAASTFLNNIRNAIHGDHKTLSQYLDQFGGKFWEETRSKIIERVTTIESDLKAAVTAKLPCIDISGSAGKKMTEEQKEEVLSLAQDVVNKIQMDSLSKVVKCMGNILKNPEQKKYYIVLDKLDEQWADDTVRYKLLRSLIDTIKFLNSHIPAVKVVACFRYDLLSRVYAETIDSGFQREKYQDLQLDIVWDHDRLEEMINQRVERLYKSRYSSTLRVTASQVLPRTIDQKNSLNYILDRTLLRPRDVIDFFNLCIGHSKGNCSISESAIKKAEITYSRSRLRSIADEWRTDYPGLELLVTLFLCRRPAHFVFGSISEDDVIELCFEYLGKQPDGSIDRISKQITGVCEGKTQPLALLRYLFEVLYHVSIVGLKLEAYEMPQWSHIDHTHVIAEQIEPTTSVFVHPCFWRALSIHE